LGTKGQLTKDDVEHDCIDLQIA